MGNLGHFFLGFFYRPMPDFARSHNKLLPFPYSGLQHSHNEARVILREENRLRAARSSRQEKVFSSIQVLVADRLVKPVTCVHDCVSACVYMHVPVRICVCVCVCVVLFARVCAHVHMYM